MYQVALLGIGTVGSSIYELLQKEISDEFNVKHVLIRSREKHKNFEKQELLTTDFKDIEQDQDIDIVIEVIGGIHPAREYIEDSLRKKRHVVTANKELLSEYGEELIQLAQEMGVSLLFEASVGGAIPVIDPMMNELLVNDISKISGIMNGTTNFILSKMKNSNLEFEEALKLAQELGYAEQNPDADILGYDAARKLAILSSLAYHQTIKMKDMKVEGITKVSISDIEWADKMGYEIKMVAVSSKENGCISATVAPFMIKKENPLSLVVDSYNAIAMDCNNAGSLMFMGRGAGKPTGSAIATNLMDIISSKPSLSSMVNRAPKEEAMPIIEKKYHYYVKVDFQDQEEKQKLEKLSDLGELVDQEESLVMITEEMSCDELQAYIDRIKGIAAVEKVSAIRILDQDTMA